MRKLQLKYRQALRGQLPSDIPERFLISHKSSSFPGAGGSSQAIPERSERFLISNKSWWPRGAGVNFLDNFPQKRQQEVNNEKVIDKFWSDSGN